MITRQAIQKTINISHQRGTFTAWRLAKEVDAPHAKRPRLMHFEAARVVEEADTPARPEDYISRKGLVLVRAGRGGLASLTVMLGWVCRCIAARSSLPKFCSGILPR